MVKSVKILIGILLGLLIIFGLFIGIVGGTMADINLYEQRRCIIFGFSIVLSGITAIVSLCSERMQFNIKTKQEISFYLSTFVSTVLFIVAYLIA